MSGSSEEEFGLGDTGVALSSPRPPQSEWVEGDLSMMARSKIVGNFNFFQISNYSVQNRYVAINVISAK